MLMILYEWNIIKRDKINTQYTINVKKIAFKDSLEQILNVCVVWIYQQEINFSIKWR